MNERHEAWLEEREILRDLMKHADQHDQAVELFLRHHAGVHAAAATGAEGPTLADEALYGLKDEDFRRVPPKVEHSVAWLLWHTTRCEDITMNLLIAGTPQVLNCGWAETVRSTTPSTGNSMNEAELDAFNAAVVISALLEYRAAVAQRTREIVQALCPGDFNRKVAPERLQQASDEGAVAPSDGWLLKYWGGRTTAGLLLMPATRHHLMHLNEITRLRKKLKA